MKSLKSLLLLSTCALLLASCSKDESANEPACDTSNLTETIVGIWTMSGASSTVEFKADGTLIDPDGHLIEGENADGSKWEDKSYTLNGQTELIVRADDENSSQYVSGTITINSFTCNQINANFFLDFTMERQ